MEKDNTLLITSKVISEHGLSDEEYAHIVALMQRTPNYIELGIWSAMWNEHCSYKSSKKWIKTLPTEGEYVICGPGENAGVIDIGDDDVLVFKMESHNHPSYIAPYHGAATGVGGILRDIFTMGARPIAVMNALRFGEPHHERTRHLVSGVVAGIGGYANSFGVPVIGGEVNFHNRYNQNILVNTFAAGITKKTAVYLSKAEGIGLPIVYLGAKTGRDGIGGSTMASTEFDDSIDKNRPTIQVGDPFTEKCLLEACLELMHSGSVIAIQDMGAAGLSCSAIEMGARGNLGITLNLDCVPVCEDNMNAYEMMLSESQERMLMVLNPEKESEAKSILVKWGLDFSIIGETTDDLRFRIHHLGKEVANLPIKELGSKAPEYNRSWVEPILPVSQEPYLFDLPYDCNIALRKILGSPDIASKRWVWEQYDTYIQGNSLILPGGDAGVIRVEGHPTKALAFSSDVTPRYVDADPFEGGKQAVAECYRNLITTGAQPLATTDNLNFGSPEKPEIMGQFVAAIRGISKACSALNMPIVSGNVSFYNETNDRSILPTPTIAGVGIIPDYTKIARVGGAHKGDLLFLVGTEGTHLARSIYQREILGEETGPSPEVNLLMEWAHGEFVKGAIRSGYVSACHDISDGGIAIALAEMCIASNYGAHCEINFSDRHPHAALFGEDQSRYIVAVDKKWEDLFSSYLEDSDISSSYIGMVGDQRLIINDLINITVEEIKEVYEFWFPNYMR
ncbi:phosphoribosylformylglycinamidine synthase subunit PurL [Candidatus Endowatersipora endosymbiont of Watersipora subatra]|uniref:phosphoribosylformylglycinamidine synthase subunit PurL n=1 Tax=Candidatus Endowatersipora endosymbiont of Watersipora subatra TaxID=3077946 RepID=UPI00312CA95C